VQYADKASARAALMALRRGVNPDRKRAWDERIGQRLLDLQARRALAELAVFWPLAGEPDLQPAYAQLAAQGVRLYLPVVLARDAALGFSAWTPGEAMHKDRMGIAVPETLRLGARPGALLLPCLGFNEEKFRLGYGGGFYDRTLAGAPAPLAIGVAYECTRAAFAGEGHDVALDVILTERATW